MGTITLREHGNVAPSNYSDGGHYIPGALITDKYGLPIKTVTTEGGTPIDSDPMTTKTYFVEIEGAAGVRFAVRPRGFETELPATSSHKAIPADGIILVRVYPGAIISFLEPGE